MSALKIVDIKDVNFTVSGVKHGAVDLAGHRYVLEVDINGNRSNVLVRRNGVDVDPSLHSSHRLLLNEFAGKDVADLIEDHFHLAHKYQNLYDNFLTSMMAGR